MAHKGTKYNTANISITQKKDHWVESFFFQDSLLFTKWPPSRVLQGILNIDITSWEVNHLQSNPLCLYQTRYIKSVCSLLYRPIYHINTWWRALWLNQHSYYSNTCLLRPPKGLTKGGLNRQVVLIQRLDYTENPFKGLGRGGLIGQVVLIKRWSYWQVLLYLKTFEYYN